MKIKSGYMLKTVAGNNIVVPVNNLDFDGIITLNETGVFLWKALVTDTSEEKLVQLILEEYNVSSDTAKKDVAAFIGTLRQENILDE